MKLKKVLLYVVPPVTIIGIIYIINKKSVQKKISDGIKNSPLPEPSSTVTKPTVTNLFPLKRGINNDKVKELQRVLGVDPVGNFGPQTESALKTFSGKITVDSQSELDALTAKKMAQQNSITATSRAQELLKHFQSGSKSIYVQLDTIAYGYVADYSGAINYNNKNINLKKGGTLNNSDYKLIGYTKSGNLQMQVTRGDLAGTYVLNPNTISLV